ncbi:Formylglycine-generating sulfatase enzyme [Stieleria maiorica]|uniref:Formylglycine-generating sulfatase enzyme n=1 Tax=Stieleria maiorica TaxID=2795974 RepID=A0A5B9MBD0_9BACT|nr:formylglycine-generating enzyme family protein [Stieleria maiorica]QEF98492.1 Formylglycine-generating sulfatase enzyme [Stieleria maiorica]
MSRTTCLTFYISLFASCTFAGGPEMRLVPEQPTEGRFVETPRGFMVAYDQPIPGSNAVIKMLPVPGGTVTIQPPPSLEQVDEYGKPLTTERPTGAGQQVSFGPYWIGKYEITIEQYLPYRQLYYRQKKDASEGINQANSPTDVDAVTGPTDVYDPDYNFEYSDAPDSPVPTVSQFAARQYTKYLTLLTGQTYRLPLRSEWQHACLAGSDSRYCFGDDATRLGEFAVYLANTSDDSLSLRVGTKKPNVWGLYDVHGNVAELVIEDTAVTGLREGHVACGGDRDSTAAECTAESVVRTTESWWDQDPDFPRSSWWMTSETSRTTGFRIIAPLQPMTDAQKHAYWDADSQELAQDVQSRLESGRGSLGRVTPPQPTTRRIDSPDLEK